MNVGIRKELRSGRALALGGLVVAVGACSTAPHHGAPEAAPVSVGVTTAHEETLPIIYRASGTVRGRNTDDAHEQDRRATSAPCTCAPGDHVTAGQSLVELEANDVRAGGRAGARGARSLGRGEGRGGERARGRARRGEARQVDVRRARVAALRRRARSPQQELDEAEARWTGRRGAGAHGRGARRASMSSSIEEAKAALGEAQVDARLREHRRARSPGRVLERRVDPGSARVARDAAARARRRGRRSASRPPSRSRAAHDVKLGDDGDVEIDGARAPLVGTVGEIVPSVDVASRAFLVKIDLPRGAAALRPGTFARVGVPTSAPATAARRPDDGDHARSARSTACSSSTRAALGCA